MARTEYAHAPEVRAIAERLIELFHPHLYSVRIEYVFVSEPPTSLGRPLNGRFRKVSGLNAFLAGDREFEGEPEPFFVMEITKPTWDVRPTRWRIALVDHELKHGGYDDEFDTICIVPHDEEEFDDIAARHGRWNEGLESFANALERGKSQEESELDLHSIVVTTHEARQKTERAPAEIDLRRFRDRRDQQGGEAVQAIL